MRFPSKEIVEQVRKKYPAGTRVKLVQMDDVQAPPVGTMGTVTAVDDTGSLIMHWDNGSHLNVVYGEDYVQKVAVTTICYGSKKEWVSRREAEEFFLRAICGCDPNSSECGRYTKIYTEIMTGCYLCTDGE